MIVNKFKLSLLVLFLLHATFSIKVSPKYPKGMEIKTNIYAIADSAVFNPPFKYDLSKWSSTWGTAQEVKGAQRMVLSNEFEGSTILKTDSINAPLVLVAYKSKTKTCIVFIRWENDAHSTNTLTKISRDECAKFRVTKFKLQKGKLVSYISKKVNELKYFYLETSVSQFGQFKTLQQDLSKKCGFMWNETHDISKIFMGTNQRDMFLIYQRNADYSGNYPNVFCNLKASSNEGAFNNESTLTLYVNNSLKSLIPTLAGYTIQQVKHVEDFFNGTSALWIQVTKGLFKNLLYTQIIASEVYNTKNLFTGKTDWYTEKDDSTLKWGSVIIENDRLKTYTFLDETGRMSMCTTRMSTFSQAPNVYQFRNSCNNFNRAYAGFNEGELVDNIFVRTEDMLAVIKTVEKGILDSESEKVIQVWASSVFPDNIDTIKNRYSAWKGYLFEIPKTFPAGSHPKYTAFRARVKIGSERLYYVKGTAPKPTEISITGWDGKTAPVTHKLDLKFVDKFWANEISDTTVQMDVPIKQVGKYYPDYEHTVQIHGDLIDLYRNPKDGEVVTFTPVKVVSGNSSALSKLFAMTQSSSKETVTSRSLQSPQQEPVIHSPEDLSGCTLDQYYVFSRGGIIQSFSKKASNDANIHAFMVDLSEYKLSTEGMVCISDDDSNLVLTRRGNKYTAISFDAGSVGQYKIITFMSDRDLTNLQKVFLNKSAVRYRLITQSGVHATLDFNNFHPAVQLKSPGSRARTTTLLGQTITFNINVQKVQ